MSQSSILEAQVAKMAALLDTVSDNEKLTKELNSRIATFTRTIAVLKQHEAYRVKIKEEKVKKLKEEEYSKTGM